MKQLFILLAASGALFTTSCKKSDSNSTAPLSGSDFKLGGETFKIDHISNSSVEVSITAHDSKGNALGVIFDEYPTTSGTFNVVTTANDPGEIQVFAAKNYAAQRWQSTEMFGAQTLEVTVADGKIHVNIKAIKLYGSEDPIIVEGIIAQK